MKAFLIFRREGFFVNSVGRNTTQKDVRNLEERRKRVARIKRILIGIIVVFLLLPSILCLALWGKVVSLEKRIDQLYQNQAVESVATPTATNTAKKNEEDKGQNEKEFDQTKIKGRKVYLTFDDGPSDNTVKILKVLKKYDVKATFFVIGRTDEKSKKLYKKIVKEGHTLGMHSYTHQYDKIYASVSAYKKDLNALADLLEDVTGEERPHYIRFPGGSSNTVSKVPMKDIIRYVNKEGYKYYDWNVVNGDADGKKHADKDMINKVVQGVKLHDTSIVLMHDCVGKEQTAKNLETTIKKLKKMKVHILPINDTTVPVQQIEASSVKK